MYSQLISWVVLLYFLAGLVYLLAAVFVQPRLNRIGLLFLWVGLGLHTLSLGWRWVDSYRLGIGHAPLSNFYESLLFFAWSLVGVVLLGYRRQARDYLGFLTATLACLLLAYASFGGMAMEINPLVPALKSNWLVVHVITCFLGYAAFTLGFGAAGLYLFQARRPKPVQAASGRIGHLELDRLVYRTTLVGFFLLTLGILTGAVWAESAWGSYWSWDPKETWSLITWLIYAALLHARLVKGWYGKRIAVLAVVGFLAMLFTYFGVSFLLPGLHAYLT